MDLSGVSGDQDGGGMTGGLNTSVAKMGARSGGENGGDATGWLKTGGRNGGGGKQASARAGGCIGGGGQAGARACACNEGEGIRDANFSISASRLLRLGLPVSDIGVPNAISAAARATIQAEASSTSTSSALGLKSSRPGGGQIPKADAFMSLEQLSNVNRRSSDKTLKRGRSSIC